MNHKVTSVNETPFKVNLYKLKGKVIPSPSQSSGLERPLLLTSLTLLNCVLRIVVLLI